MLNDKKNTDTSFLLRILALLTIIYFAHALYFPGSFQGGDGLRHYLVSRYSWKHPEQLLYLWGKPFFTLVSSPFSQGGLIGIKVFNIICAILSCIIIFRIAVKLKIDRPFLAALFLGFTPMYFFATNSGYTEILFGLLLVFSIQQYMNRNFFWSTILISFLPFVRSEGYVLIPLFFIILLLRRKYFIIPLLAVGNVVYSIIGYFYYHDIFWLRTQNPYDGHMAAIYGHGPLLHFVKAYKIIWGIPLTILLIAGLIYAIMRFIKKEGRNKEFSAEEFFLIYGSFAIYFVSHSFFWWKGLFNSLGLERVMAAVIPVTALISLRGFNLISSISVSKLFQKSIIAIFVIAILIVPFLNSYFPLKLEPEEQLVVHVKTWYEGSGYKNTKHKIYYLHPYLPEALSFDAFDEKTAGELWGLYPAIKTWGYDAIPDSSLVFWDAHYGPNEAAISLDTLAQDKHFRFLKAFYPEEPFKVIGDRPFEIDVFQKIKPVDNFTAVSEKSYDYESTDGLENIQTLTETKALSGKKSAMFNQSIEYGATIIEKTKIILNPDSVRCIHFETNVMGSGKLETNAILSLHKDDNQVGWFIYPIEYNINKKNDWEKIEGEWKIDSTVLKKADYMKIYIWNNHKQNFYVDDFKIKFQNTCK